MNNSNQLTVNSPEIQSFLTAWHENGRARWTYENLDYDTDQAKKAIDRRKYIALDCGTSGSFLVDKVTHQIWTISAYGVPNKRWNYGTVEQMTEKFLAATATFA